MGNTQKSRCLVDTLFFPFKQQTGRPAIEKIKYIASAHISFANGRATFEKGKRRSVGDLDPISRRRTAPARHAHPARRRQDRKLFKAST